MNTPSEHPKTSVLSRMENAINGHDIEAFVDCFSADFVSEQQPSMARREGGFRMIYCPDEGAGESSPGFQPISAKIGSG
jgi:hypothetical protein